jgi:hypothetical protein
VLLRHVQRWHDNIVSVYLNFVYGGGHNRRCRLCGLGVSLEKVGGLPGVLSSHGRDNQPLVQPSVYGWNRRWPLRVRSVSGEGGDVAYTFNDIHRPD